jgi:small-conductance mechanosensitive channel
MSKLKISSFIKPPSLLLFLLLLQLSLLAKPLKKAEVDSLRKVTIARRHALADSIRSQVVPVVYSFEYADSLLQQIEHLHSTLNNITNQSRYGFKTVQIENELNQMQEAIQVISQSLGRDSMVLNINNLQLYRGLLKDMEVKLRSWRDVLYQDHKDLANMSDEMHAFAHDSFTQKVAADTAFATLHLEEMLILRERWHEARASTNRNLAHISQLQSRVSTAYFDITEYQNTVNNQLVGMAVRAFGKEYQYIWKLQQPPGFDDVMAYTAQSFTERMKVLRYYLALNISDWLVIIILGLVYFIWVFRNFRRLKLLSRDEKQEEASFKYIRPLPVLSTVLFILNIAPFYGFDQPAVYVQILQLLLLIPLTIRLFTIWPKNLIYYWGILILITLLTTLVSVVITPGWPLRFLLLGLNISAVLFGFRFLSAYNKDLSLGKPVKFATIFLIVMNLLAIIANTMGRLTLAKILTSSGVIGLTQITGLFVLIPMLTEAFHLQMKSTRLAAGTDAKFNYEEIRAGLYQLLSALFIFFWFITLATNLEIYSYLLQHADTLLNTPRSVGSTSYTIGNILTFIFILYLVSVLQKYVGYFFGETDEDFLGDLDKKESGLVIFRLIIIMVGFFIAVVASGLPVDKVTVVLGALGVGIGLGLQNIVFNLISGVILIFEKPMQIGDYIEVADKKGRVQSIGIRSSKLITSDGSEVIVPNGDILSSHMVNWTRSNNNRRTQLGIKFEPASQLQLAKDTILEELKNSAYVIHDRQVEILVENLSEQSVEILINVWINSIYKEQQFRSEVLAGIYTKLAAKGIKIIG